MIARYSARPESLHLPHAHAAGAPTCGVSMIRQSVGWSSIRPWTVQLKALSLGLHFLCRACGSAVARAEFRETLTSGVESGVLLRFCWRDSGITSCDWLKLSHDCAADLPNTLSLSDGLTGAVLASSWSCRARAIRDSQTSLV